MKHLRYLVAVLILGCSAAASDPTPKIAIVLPAEGASSAASIGEQALIAKYGEREVRAWRPFRAFRKEEKGVEVWIVRGTVPKSTPGVAMFGGDLVAVVRKKDGAVLSVTQGP